MKGVRDRVNELLTVVRSASEFAGPWRNKRLAHKDLEHALATSETPLPGVSRASIEGALAAIRELMDAVQVYYEDTSTAYADVVLGSGDGNGLARVVQAGLDAEHERRERLQAELAAMGGPQAEQALSPDASELAHNGEE